MPQPAMRPEDRCSQGQLHSGPLCWLLSSLSLRAVAHSAESCMAARLRVARVICLMGATAAMPQPAAEAVGAARVTPPQASAMQQSAGRQRAGCPKHICGALTWCICSEHLSCTAHWQHTLLTSSGAAQGQQCSGVDGMLAHPMTFGCTSRRWLMISRSVNLVSPTPSCRQQPQLFMVHAVPK